MNKDPAFLFYSKDFYEGTRLMLPEERACYIDLMIYQHQQGPIPDDIPRLQMYCSGCSAGAIQRVLNEHFNQTPNGWLNKRLTREVNLRAMGKPKKMAAAVFAGLISASKLTKRQKEQLKRAFVISDFIQEGDAKIVTEEEIKKRIRQWFNQMVNQPKNKRLTIIANENEDVNAIEHIITNEDEPVKQKKATAPAMPWEDPEFVAQWQQWKTYKQKEFNFSYRSVQSEQAALQRLATTSSNQMQTAIAILHQSMANGWKGFFQLKQNPKTGEQIFTEALGSEVGRNFRFK